VSDCLPCGVGGFYVYTYLYGCRTRFLVGHSFIQFPFVFALYSHLVSPQPYYVGICFFALQLNAVGDYHVVNKICFEDSSNQK